MIYPEAIWYGNVSEKDIEKIIDEHLVKGKVVESLLINDERFNPKLMKNAKIEALKDEH